MRNLLSVFILMLPFLYMAQEDEKKISITDVYLMSGSNYMSTNIENVSVFQQMAPNSSILAQDMSQFESMPFFPKMGTSPNKSSSLLLGLSFAEKPHQSLRLGFNHSMGTYALTNYSRTTFTPYDTLTSSQTGEQIFIDSMSTTSINGTAFSEYLGLEGSLLFRSSNEARWSFFGGVGLSLRFCFNNRVNVTESTYEGVSGEYSYSNYNYGNNWKTENFKGYGYLSTSIFFPLGIDLRIGKNRDFWKIAHLFMELRPNLTIASIPDYTTVISPSMVGNFGLRITW